MLRLATSADAEGILEIYAPYIEKTSLTFETETPTLTEFAERINSYLENWPWLVYEIEGSIAGYAYASKHRERKGYQWGVECSIYIHDAFMGSGIAKKLYEALFRILKVQNFATVYAVINLPNDRSVRFHELMGFKYFATFENVGYKLGQWKNVGWWQLQLNPYVNEPPLPIMLNKLQSKVIQALIEPLN